MSTEPIRALSDIPAEELRALRLRDFPVHRRVTTRWNDLDTYGHVNNVVHYEMMDTTVCGWLMEESGADIRNLPEINMVVETGLRYFAEVNFPQVVTVGLRLESAGRSSVRYQLALFTDADEPVAVGRFVHVYVDRESRRSAPIPSAVRDALARLQA